MPRTTRRSTTAPRPGHERVSARGDRARCGRVNWEQRKARSGKGRGAKVTGVGVGQAFHSAGRSGYDGLVRITPDGKLHIHSGVGNLGTYSYGSTSRVAAEVLKCKWRTASSSAATRASACRGRLAVGQQHLVHDDACRIRRCRGRSREAERDRGDDARRRSGRLRRGRRDRVLEEGQGAPA